MLELGEGLLKNLQSIVVMTICKRGIVMSRCFFAACLLCITFILSSLGCVSEAKLSNDSDINVNDINDEMTPKSDGPASSKGVAKVTTDKSLFEDFLCGKESMVFHIGNFYGYGFYEPFSYVDDNKAFTLPQIFQKIRDSEEDVHVKEAYYSYIDCMDDGSAELYLSIKTYMGDIEPSWEGDIIEVLLVIANKNNQLHMIYEDTSNFNNYREINQYGYVGGFDRGGYYTNNSFNYILTYEGPVFISGCIMEAATYLESFKAYVNEQIIEVDLSSIVEAGGEAYRYYFDENGIYEDEYYSYDVQVGVDESDPSYDKNTYNADTPYMKAFAAAGVKAYPKPELENRIVEKEKTLGVTEETKEWIEPKWERLKM